MNKIVPSFEVVLDAAGPGRFAGARAVTLGGQEAAAYTTWDTIVSDLRIAQRCLVRFRARQGRASAERGTHAEFLDPIALRDELVVEWTTAVTFFFRCYKANGRREHFLTEELFCADEDRRAINVVKANRDKAIHHSVNSADDAAVGVAVNDGEIVGFFSAANRRFFPPPGHWVTAAFQSAIERGLSAARSALYWASIDLEEHVGKLLPEQLRELPEGLWLLDADFGWGTSPRPPAGSRLTSVASGTPRLGPADVCCFAQGIRGWETRVVHVRTAVPEDGVLLNVDGLTDIVVRLSPDQSRLVNEAVEAGKPARLCVKVEIGPGNINNRVTVVDVLV